MNVFKRFNLLFMKKVFYLLVFLVGTLGNLSAQMVLFEGTFEEAEEKAKAIAEALGWEDKYYLISAASGLGVKDLCWDVMTFIIENPVVQAEEAKQPEKVEFMWDDYHRQQLEEIAEEDDEDWDDDWDEDDEEGVEFIYKR